MDHDYISDDGEAVAKVSRTRPKITTTMCDEDITKLISMVESNPCIWNAGDREYSNKISRKNAWRSICEMFAGRYDENDLRAKWSNLRIQYRINATKWKGKSWWRHYTALNFIGHVEDSQQQETTSNLSFEDSIDSENTPVSRQLFKKRSSRPAHVETESAATAIMETMRDAVKAINTNNEANHANMAFCKYIYEELKQMPEGQASFIRKRIMELLITREVKKFFV